MLKELEEKAILNFVEEEKEPIEAVKVDIKYLDNDIYAQNIIPEKDYNDLYKECMNNITNIFDDPDIIVYRVLLDKYTNILVETLSDKEVSDVFDTIEYEVWLRDDSAHWRLINEIQKYYKIFVVENIVKKTMEEYFNDQVTRNAFEQIQKDLESMDMEKIKGLLEIFGATNSVNIGG